MVVIAGVKTAVHPVAPSFVFNCNRNLGVNTGYIHIRRCYKLIRRIEAYIYRLVNFFLIFQGISLIIVIGLEVFFRYVIGKALSWPEEVAGIFFMWFTLLGVAAVLREGGHIAFNFLMKYTPPLVGKIIELFCMLMIQVYAFFMIYHGYSYARMFTFETTPAAKINLLWMTLSLPISGLLIIIFSLLKIVGIFKLPERSGS
jgi:TRAP-type C4-dicarboxylate transport system permease small subunit